MLKYHNCIDLENTIYGELESNIKYSEPDYKKAYSWLEKQVGFYPLFLAVGETEEDMRMTGYQNNWRRLILMSRNGNEYRKKGEFPNLVLFSFEEVDGVFMDYDAWHFVLNAGYKNYNMTDYEKRCLFKPSWSKSKWLRKAKKEPHRVQLAAPKLYLPDAKRVWVRNKKTKRLLGDMGFESVEVKRIKIED